jgi:hypothetical protein
MRVPTIVNGSGTDVDGSGVGIDPLAVPAASKYDPESRKLDIVADPLINASELKLIDPARGANWCDYCKVKT